MPLRVAPGARRPPSDLGLLAMGEDGKSADVELWRPDTDRQRFVEEPIAND